jgi:hypothetical protein
LTSNCDLPEGSKVTITGLTGSATDTSATLSVQSTSDKLGAQGNWNKDGALILTAASGGVLVGVSVEVKFNLSNPSTGYTSPSVSVEAAIEFSGTAVGTIQRVSMTKPNSTLFGVAHGRNPLQVLVPDLTVKTIQQSTPFSGANNELTVNLTSNCDLPEGSKVTITGLTGSASGATNTLTVSLTADFDLPAGSTVTITGLTGSQTTGQCKRDSDFDVGHLLGSSGAWTQTPGQLVLTVAGSGARCRGHHAR